MICEEDVEGQRRLAVETQPLTDGPATGHSRDAAGAVSRFVEFYNLNATILQLNGGKKTPQEKHND